MADIKIEDIKESDLEETDLKTWNAYHQQNGGDLTSFLANNPEIIKKITDRKLKNVADEIANKEIDFTNAVSDEELKDSMADLSSFSFSNEKGEPDPEINKLFYELAQNETYADCLDEVNTDKYKRHLSDNIDTIKEELIVNQVIFENCKDIDISKLSEEKREELKQNYAKLIENAREEFKKGQFKISPEVTAATMAIHNEDIKVRAEKHGVRALIDRVKNFDEKATKKFPKLYPLAKNMLINAGAGMIAGPLGLAVVSGVKTFQSFKKLKKEANSQNKTLKEYLKENKTAAWSLGFQIAGSVITTAIGIDAGISGNFGMLHQGAVPYKTAFGARVGRVSASVGAGLSSAFGQLKKGNLKQGIKTISLTAVAAGAGLILGEHGSEWVHKIFGGNQPEVDTVSGADANQIDQTTPTAQQQTLNNNIDPSRPAVAPELQGASTAAQRFEMANDPTTEYGGTHSQPQAPMEETPTTSLDDNHSSATRTVTTPQQPNAPYVDEPTLGDNATQAEVDAAAMVQEVDEQAQNTVAAEIANHLSENAEQQHIAPSTLEVPQESSVESLQQTIAGLQEENGGFKAVNEPIAQTVNLEQVDITAERVTPQPTPDYTAVPDNEAFVINNNDLSENPSLPDMEKIGQNLKDDIIRGSTNAYTDAAHPLHDVVDQPVQPTIQNNIAEQSSNDVMEDIRSEKLILGSEGDAATPTLKEQLDKAVAEAESAASKEVAENLQQQVEANHPDPSKLEVPQEMSTTESLQKAINDLQGENGGFKEINYTSEVANIKMPESKLDDYGDAYIGRLPEGYSYANGENTMGEGNVGVVAQNADILDENQHVVAHQQIVKFDDHTKLVSTTNLETNEVTAAKIVDGKVVEMSLVDGQGNQTSLTNFDNNGNVTHRITPTSEYNAEYNDQNQLVHSEKTSQLVNGHIREEDYNLENDEHTTIDRDGNEILSKKHIMTDEKGITCMTEDKGTIHKESQFNEDKPLFEQYDNSATGAHSDTNYSYKGDKLTDISHVTNIKGDVPYDSHFKYEGDKLTGEVCTYGNDHSTLKTTYNYNEGETTPSSMSIEAKDATGKVTEKYEVDTKTGAWKHFDASGKLLEQGGYEKENVASEPQQHTTKPNLDNAAKPRVATSSLEDKVAETRAKLGDAKLPEDTPTQETKPGFLARNKGWIIGGVAVAGGGAWYTIHNRKKAKETADRVAAAQQGLTYEQYKEKETKKKQANAPKTTNDKSSTDTKGVIEIAAGTQVR